MAMRVSPMRNMNNDMSMGRVVPIARSPYSFFEPTWEVGQWHDFGPIYRRMEERMREMNREIDQMFRRFTRLMPLEHYTPNMQALPAPNMQALPAPIMPAMSAPPALPEPQWGCTSSSTALTPAHTITPPAMLPPPMMPEMPKMKPMTMAEEWKMENPIVTEKDGSRRLKLEFDVHQFRPEEVTVRSLDNQLTVYARHQEDGPNGRIFREYHRQFLLPQTVQLETLCSVLSPEGVLTVTAPMPPAKALPEPSRERVIPIEYTPRIKST